MLHLRTVSPITLGLALLACDPYETTDQGQYGFLTDLNDWLGEDSDRILVGSTFEFDIHHLMVEGELDPQSDWVDCVSHMASGSLTKVGDEYYVGASGPGAIEIAAPSATCLERQGVLAELEPDSWTIVGVEPDAATGRWVSAGDAVMVAVHAVLPGPAEKYADAIGEPLSDVRVAAGGRFSIGPVLVDLAAGERAEVRWNDADADQQINVPEQYIQLTTYVHEDGVAEPQRALAGALEGGESVAASLTILDHDFQLPNVDAVAVTEIVSLELVPGYWPSLASERDWGAPIGVIALAHDADGDRILGAPVEWSVSSGRLIVSDQESDDMIKIDDCRDLPQSPEWRRATVQATLGDLVAEVELEWLALPSDYSNVDSPDCTGPDSD